MKNKFPSPSSPLRIGTRGSPLALAQAYETRKRLTNALNISEDSFEIVVISTSGDRILDRPLKEVGGKGLFTKEIEQDMLDRKIDIAVHSMKDMPVEQPDGLTLGCYLPREDVRDAFVSSRYKNVNELPSGSKVGTSSLRRKAQLKFSRPDLEVVEFRGNVQTRLKKLKDGVATCTFLAMAGLNRLGLEEVAQSTMNPNEMLPAIAQGAIGIEWREEDRQISDILKKIHHEETGQRLNTERAFLAELDGSCQTPIAGLAIIEGSSLKFTGQVLRTDGSESISETAFGDIEDGPRLGREMAQKILSQAGPEFFDWRD
ncbi:MAG: hydroxymethylbilane synthase [Rhodobacteraceae bacterium TMED160]|nr:MAG: hydroxymethylbilane synthase [Rhodobacteraceae bacterium TMED160]